MEATLKVGELARRSGMTVRTLHHYDEIGLLSPSTRTPSGHRLYGPTEIRRLQQIASLRQIGLPLEEIRDCLARPEYSLESVLDLHATRIREQIGQQEELFALVERLRDRVRAADGIDVDEVLETIEMTVRYEKYFSSDQLNWLEERREAVGPERMQSAQEDWADLYADFGRAMDGGLDPSSDEVQALVARSAALIREFTGGNPEIARSLGRLYEAEGGADVVKRHGMSMPDGLWEYMERARIAGPQE